jgi:hypothetical protein
VALLERVERVLIHHTEDFEAAAVIVEEQFIDEREMQVDEMCAQLMRGQVADVEGFG